MHQHAKGIIYRFSALAAITLLFAAAGMAQITTTGIHGIVRDPSGAVIPNAVVKLKDTATGIEKSTTAGAEGAFAFANLVAGTYQLTASAPGFQNAILNDITVDTGRITDVAVSMTVGAASQTVEVAAAGAQLETTSNEVGTTINNNSIQNLPYAFRDTLQFALLMAGNASGNDASGRNSTYNGLPNASMNISIDGMNNNSQRFKSGGTSFFAFAPARIDAMDQVSVSTTGLGADASAEGAMSIRLTTKRGTDQYHFAVGEQFANEDLNSNSFFANLRGQKIAKNRQNNPYGSVGGPLLPFIPSMRHKLFFFAYFEAQPQPGSRVSSGAVFTPAAQAGNFTYNGTDGQQHTINLLQAAGAAGLTSTVDPTVAGIVSAINGSQSKSFQTLPITGQPYWQTMYWNQPTKTLYLFPTARLDYQVTPKVAWHGTWNLRYQNIDGAPNYPGMTDYNYGGAYKITTYVATNAVDWTITPHILNNVNFGVQSNGEYFYRGSDPSQWGIYGNRNIVFPGFTGATINPVVVNQTPFIRNNPVYQVNDTLTWVRGKHTMTIGGTLLHTSFYETSYGSAGVPSYNLGLASGDPAQTILQSALPGINTQNGDLNNAWALYALLTGRVSSISGSTNVDEKTHQFLQFAPVTQRFAFTTGGVFFQDSYRVRSSLTLNYGMRWQFDGAIHNTNGIDSEPAPGSFFGPSTGLFQPGVLSGNLSPQLVLVKVPYKSDYVNPAPNFGFAWNPWVENGFFGRLLGKGKTVFRGAYSITYYNEGMNAISNVLSGNQGTSQAIFATPGNPGFTLGGLNLSSPPPPLQVFPSSFTFPIPQSNYVFSGGNPLYYINPNLVTPYVQNWNLNVQRELPGGIALQVGYVGNKATHMWHYQNINEVNIFENGFLDQFKAAQQNLAINAANGKGNTFANNGLPGQAALPIFEAAFGANGSAAALPAGSGFTNAAFITQLQQGLAGSMATTLASTNSTSPGYYCRLVGSNFAPCAAAGFTNKTAYPLNFFTPNPFASSLNYQDDNGVNTYNALQIVAQKSLKYGLFAAANYTWSHALGDMLNLNNQTAGYQWSTMRNARLSYGPSPFDRRQVFNAYWTYELPFGKGKWVNISNAVLDRVIGGWTIGGVETIQTGAPFILASGRLTVNNFTGPGAVGSGVVFGSGLTPGQLADRLGSIPDMNRVTRDGSLLSSVTDIQQSNGSANPAYYGPASTPGVFGAFVYLHQRTQFTMHMSLNKEVRIHERLHMGFRMEALNFLNHPFFQMADPSPTSTTFGEVNTTWAASTDSRYNRVVLLRAFMRW